MEIWTQERYLKHAYKELIIVISYWLSLTVLIVIQAHVSNAGMLLQKGKE